MSNLCRVLMVKGEEWNSRALRFGRGVAKTLVSSRGAGWGGRVAPGRFANRSGNSSSESLKSSSSSSSEPRITALRSLTAVDEGTGGDEEKRAAGNGVGDGGGGVELADDEVGEEAALNAGRGGLCDGFGAGLKKLVMLAFFDMLGCPRHITACPPGRVVMVVILVVESLSLDLEGL